MVNLEFKKYLENEAQILNALCPVVSMLKMMREKNKHYERNTVVSHRTGETLDGYLIRLYNVVQDLENANTEARRKENVI